MDHGLAADRHPGPLAQIAEIAFGQSGAQIVGDCRQSAVGIPGAYAHPVYFFRRFHQAKAGKATVQIDHIGKGHPQLTLTGQPERADHADPVTGGRAARLKIGDDGADRVGPAQCTPHPVAPMVACGT